VFYFGRKRTFFGLTIQFNEKRRRGSEKGGNGKGIYGICKIHMKRG
jgi:hypothetical protein